jgi:hypothetical protein
MVDERLKNLRGPARRRFLKFTAAAGAVLALDQAEVLNVLSDSAGSAMAEEGACSATTNRSIHLVAGGGGFAWFQLLWPHNAVAAANNDGFAFHANGQSVLAGDTDNPLTHAPETPWTSLDRTKRMSAFMAGNNETHTAQPTSAATLGGGVSMLAAAATLQSQLPALLPVIGITPFNFGNAPGAPAVTSVGNADGMVELFNSASSQALLSIQSDADLYESYYKAFLSLNRASARPTFARQLRITKASANFLGKNLAEWLKPTADDMMRYGITGGSPNKLVELAKALITTTKAFKHGLTNSVIIPTMRDDPHGAFGNMGTLASTIETLGRILDATMDDLLAVDDPVCSGKKLADTTVITIHGDTPKTPLNRNNWPDGTPGDSNWIYVYGAGYTKTGWFGGIQPGGAVDGFDPATGATLAGAGVGGTAAAAGAAVAYAIAQGDLGRVQDIRDVPSIGGIVNETLM